MENLLLLFTKDGLQWQINKASTTIEEEAFFVNEEENNPTFIEKKLEDVLQSNPQASNESPYWLLRSPKDTFRSRITDLRFHFAGS